jgi:hypothetical protein
MRDAHFLILSVVALVLYLGACCLPLLGHSARPALAVVTGVTALGIVAILLFEVRSWDPPIVYLVVGELIALGSAVAALLSNHRAALWCLGIAIGLHVLLLLVVLAFLTLFKLKRLW